MRVKSRSRGLYRLLSSLRSALSCLVLVFFASVSVAHGNVAGLKDAKTFTGDTTNLSPPPGNAPFLFEFPLITADAYIPTVDSEQGTIWTFKNTGTTKCDASICIHPYSPLPRDTVVISPTETASVAPALASWDKHCMILQKLEGVEPNDDPVHFTLYPTPGPTYVSVGVQSDSTGCKFELSYDAPLTCDTDKGQYGDKCAESVISLGPNSNQPQTIPPKGSQLYVLAPQGRSLVSGEIQFQADQPYTVYTFENAAPSVHIDQGYDLKLTAKVPSFHELPTFNESAEAPTYNLTLTLSGVRFLNESVTSTPWSARSQQRFFGTFVRVQNTGTEDMKVTVTTMLSRCQTFTTGSKCGLALSQITPDPYSRSPNFACCDDSVKFGIYYGSLNSEDIAQLQSEPKKALSDLASRIPELAAPKNTAALERDMQATDDPAQWSFGLGVGSQSQLPGNYFPAVYLRRGNIPLLDEEIAPSIISRDTPNPFLWTPLNSRRKGYDMRIDTSAVGSRFVTQALIDADKTTQVETVDGKVLTDDSSGVAWYYMVIVSIPSTSVSSFSDKTEESKPATGSLRPAASSFLELASEPQPPVEQNELKLVAWGGSVCPSSCSHHGTCGTTSDPHQCVCDEGYTQFPDCSVEPSPPSPSSGGSTPLYLQFWFIMVCVAGGLLLGLAISLLWMKRHKRERFLAFFDASTVDSLAKESKVDPTKSYLFHNDQIAGSGATSSAVPNLTLGGENMPLLTASVPGQPKRDSSTYGGVEDAPAVVPGSLKFVHPTPHRASMSGANGSAPSVVLGSSPVDAGPLADPALLNTITPSTRFSFDNRTQSDTNLATGTPAASASPQVAEFGDLIQIGVVGAGPVAQFEDDSQTSSDPRYAAQKRTMGVL